MSSVAVVVRELGASIAETVRSATELEANVAALTREARGASRPHGSEHAAREASTATMLLADIAQLRRHIQALKPQVAHVGAADALRAIDVNYTKSELLRAHLEAEIRRGMEQLHTLDHALAAMDDVCYSVLCGSRASAAHRKGDHAQLQVGSRSLELSVLRDDALPVSPGDSETMAALRSAFAATDVVAAAALQVQRRAGRQPLTHRPQDGAYRSQYDQREASQRRPWLDGLTSESSCRLLRSSESSRGQLLDAIRQVDEMLAQRAALSTRCNTPSYTPLGSAAPVERFRTEINSSVQRDAQRASSPDSPVSPGRLHDAFATLHNLRGMLPDTTASDEQDVRRDPGKHRLNIDFDTAAPLGGGRDAANDALNKSPSPFRRVDSPIPTWVPPAASLAVLGAALRPLASGDSAVSVENATTLEPSAEDDAWKPAPLVSVLAPEPETLAHLATFLLVRSLLEDAVERASVCNSASELRPRGGQESVNSLGGVPSNASRPVPHAGSVRSPLATISAEQLTRSPDCCISLASSIGRSDEPSRLRETPSGVPSPALF
jgi:hypothetical protein